MTAPFDHTGPLPSGTTLLEASAGTGKTYAISSLATRYVAEDVARLDQLLFVTFGVSATREMRERIRQRFVATELALREVGAGRLAPATIADNVIALLADTSAEEREARRTRLAAALATFDTATIATTHEFCQQMLTNLGVLSGVAPRETFTDDLSDLETQVVDDLFVRKYAGGERVLIDRKSAGAIARAVLANPFAAVVTEPPGSETLGATRARLACAARDEITRRRRALGLVTFDDLISRVDEALRDPLTGPAACHRLRDRYRVVLADEFQDTDPVQWRILRTAFARHAALVLIGDPKQAIYGFRGGDVTTYLAAATTADHRATLETNHRSDAALVEELANLLGETALGDDAIRVYPVQPGIAERRITGPGTERALRLRVVPGPWPDGAPTAKMINPVIARDAAVELVRMLQAGTTLTLDGTPRPLRPGDIAVLVNAGWQGMEMQRELLARGVNAVLEGGGSVFTTGAARDWLTLLRCMDQPHRPPLLRAAMLTPFLGHTGTELLAEGDVLADQAAVRIREWAAALRTGGVAALMQSIESAHGLMARVLRLPDGERRLTDLRHVAEALHLRSRTASGTAGLTEWLAAKVREPEAVADETTRRLDRDADLVHIVTVHKSKGLQFPVVFLPWAWNDRVRTAPDALNFHDEHGNRVVDVRGDRAPLWHLHVAQHQAEDAAEGLRKLYVALTRAQCQVVAWWAPSKANTMHSPLHRLLCARLEGTDEPDDEYGLDRITADRLVSELGLAAEVVDRGAAAPKWMGAATESPRLALAPFDRSIDTSWRRTSYSGITASIHEQHYGAPDDDPSGSRTDEPETGAEPLAATGGEGSTGSAAEEALAALLSPMGDLPAGTNFGTVVHAVLEQVDTSAASLGDELAQRCAQALARRPVGDLTPERLAQALVPVMQTPLGRLAEGTTLAGIAPQDRLAELDFEYPMAGGDLDDSSVLLGGLTAALRRHLDPADPLAGYADLLDEAGLSAKRLSGFLSGSIDAVFRLPSAAGPRFVVCDYKTNYLGVRADGALTAWDYRPEAMAAEMMAAHYPLQALLYSVALHRYLRWRLPDYDPERHLGGVLYLFLRGMCGPGTPVHDGAVAGVFAWSPPAAMIVEASAALTPERPA